MLIEKTNSSIHQCNNKKGVLTEKYKLSDHLIVFEISDNMNTTEIPHNIVLIENKKYSVVAAVEYVPGLPGDLGSVLSPYSDKAHCKSGAKW